MKLIIQRDASVWYEAQFLEASYANAIIPTLLEQLRWKQDIVKLYGKTHVVKRKYAWYGDAPYNYRYSGSDRIALPWTDLLLELKQRCEAYTKSTYNSCLANLYHNGDEGVTWHSDSEKTMKEGASIASISLGQERIFEFKHKHDAERKSILLEHGSLLEMKGDTQRFWSHCLPTSKRYKQLRINLTFRTFVP